MRDPRNVVMFRHNRIGFVLDTRVLRPTGMRPTWYVNQEHVSRNRPLPDNVWSTRTGDMCNHLESFGYSGPALDYIRDHFSNTRP